MTAALRPQRLSSAVLVADRPAGDTTLTLADNLVKPQALVDQAPTLDIALPCPPHHPGRPHDRVRRGDGEELTAGVGTTAQATGVHEMAASTLPRHHVHGPDLKTTHPPSTPPSYDASDHPPA
ncbi:hypothetical protein [Streptomyces noursei]|uniref:hypothetical protein n=1 Tax=Streptomyces noursei TaxID=1971 RepID=UPI0011AEEE2A|nr:hypothetical protein [Streptomyces noursei]